MIFGSCIFAWISLPLSCFIPFSIASLSHFLSPWDYHHPLIQRIFGSGYQHKEESGVVRVFVFRMFPIVFGVFSTSPTPR